MNTEVGIIKKMEPQMGIEPTSQPWQGRVLTIVLLRHLLANIIILETQFNCNNFFQKNKKNFIYIVYKYCLC